MTFRAITQVSKVKGDIITDMLGLMLFIIVHSADVQGTPNLLAAIVFPGCAIGYVGGKLGRSLKGQ